MDSNDEEQKKNYSPFDPLSYDSLKDCLLRKFNTGKLYPLYEISPFWGAGIYAIYYDGDFSSYSLLSKVNSEDPGTWPIYVGRASAAKGRKGKVIDGTFSVKRQLFDRLEKHAVSIKAAKNLKIEDFQVRTLVLEPTWIPLAEIVALGKHKTPWNDIVEGFGNNPTGGPRSGQKRSKWDTLHPGREAVGTGRRKETKEDIMVEVEEYLRRQYGN